MQCILTFDIGAEKTKYCVLDLNLNILGKGSYFTENKGGNSIINQIKDIILDFQKKVLNINLKDTVVNYNELDLIAVGISTGGVVNHDDGFVKYANTTMKDYSGLNIKEYLKDEIDIPVFIENDVNCAMIYELDYGKIKLRKNAMLISINSGIGSSVVFDGNLYKGTEDFAGEIAYMNMYNSTVEEVMISHKHVSEQFYIDLVYLLTNLYYVNASDIFLLKGKLIDDENFDIEKLRAMFQEQKNKPLLEKVKISKVTNSKFNSCLGVGSLVLDYIDNMSARYIK